ncbi:MAG: glycosyltransferase [Candidatus Symbiothrix sp.]|jgi:uncharacterized protein (TIGR00661 family)|nr:glycosyltransferase [Candidatus Symbiothrix sp.]
MKFVFVVQGEGRGHLTQAIALKKMLLRNGHEVAAVLVGKSKYRELPEFFFRQIEAPVFRFNSPYFLPAAHKKKTNIWLSAAYNLMKTPIYLHSLYFIHKKINELNPDWVINFYEMMSGMTYLLWPPKVPYISVAHQYLLLHPDYPFPENENLAELKTLKFFNYVTSFRSKKRFALSIEPKTDVGNKKLVIVPPLLREEILLCKPTTGDYLHGYILNASYSEEIIEYQKTHPNVGMHFFWDKKDVPAETIINEKLTFHKLDDQLFIHYMAGCKAYATTAGFESVCEAMYLGKPVLMVPTHIEQACNAHEAALAGAGIMSDDFDLDALLQFVPQYRGNKDFHAWAQSSEQKWMEAIGSLKETDNAKKIPSSIPLYN